MAATLPASLVRQDPEPVPADLVPEGGLKIFLWKALVGTVCLAAILFSVASIDLKTAIPNTPQVAVFSASWTSDESQLSTLNIYENEEPEDKIW